MKKVKPFIVNHGTYPFDILVCIGSSDAEVIAILSKSGCELDSEDKELLKINGDGRTIMLVGGQTVLRLKDLKDKSYLIHEIFHAVEFLFNKIGIKHDLTTSGEAYAYQMQYIFKEIDKHLCN
jgi:hypothetical protein